MYTIEHLAAALNGKIEGDHVRCPGPGHSTPLPFTSPPSRWAISWSDRKVMA